MAPHWPNQIHVKCDSSKFGALKVQLLRCQPTRTRRRRLAAAAVDVDVAGGGGGACHATPSNASISIFMINFQSFLTKTDDGENFFLTQKHETVFLTSFKKLNVVENRDGVFLAEKKYFCLVETWELDHGYKQ